MKFILIVILFSVLNNVEVKANEYTCPVTSNVMKINSNDKLSLLKSLSTIIPKIYGPGEEYKEWNIERVAPMKSLVGSERDYYKMAINFCGDEIATNTWFVRVRFPRLLPAQSASLGEMFIVKNNINEWIVWFRYH